MKLLPFIALILGLNSLNAQQLTGVIYLNNNDSIKANRNLGNIPNNSLETIAVKNKKPTYKLEVDQNTISHIRYDYYGHEALFYRFKLADKHIWARVLKTIKQQSILLFKAGDKDLFLLKNPTGYQAINPANSSKLLNLFSPNEKITLSDLEELKYKNKH